MKNKGLQLYTIMPLDTEHLEEICQDVRDQIESGVATCALFKMKLVPEGNPVTDKAAILCEKYDLFKERLSQMGIGSGILVQATIGHGWTLGEQPPFTQYVNFCDGKTISIMCPYDEGFLEYIKNAFATIAKHSPDCIMVDDDLRLMSARGMGCGCKLHMKKFNEYANTSLAREELWDIVSKKSDKCEEYTQIMVKTQLESIILAARVMREGIDSVNPSIPGSFCCVGNNVEGAYEIAKVLAGEGNPIVVRLNNGHYVAESNHNFSTSFHRAAEAIAKLRDKADIILAETDTCPQNRYSTGAMSMHTQFVGTLLEGAAGAKHWITRLGAYEPKSGEAYRKVFSKYRGLYEELARIVPDLKWRGCRIPVSNTPKFDFIHDAFIEENAWGCNVLERLGIPMYYSDKTDGVTCLEGDISGKFCDAQISEILSGNVILASDTAKQLIELGYGEYLGIDVREWAGKTPIAEKLYVNNTYQEIQPKLLELVPQNDKIIADSGVYNTTDGENYTYLFPGTTIYKNSFGGTVFVFSGTPDIEYGLNSIFSYLNYSRKEQLIKMIESVGELPIYYPGDEEVYFRAADMPDGGKFAAVFNLSCDIIKNLEIVCDFDVENVIKLMPDGTYEKIDFEKSGNKIVTDITCNPLEPVILMINEI